jgi:hypothetical protein
MCHITADCACGHFKGETRGLRTALPYVTQLIGLLYIRHHPGRRFCIAQEAVCVAFKIKRLEVLSLK